jgi:E3 ubiquitin-protein ligase Mdm2
VRTSDSGLGSQVLDESTSAMCNSCDARPKDGVFVHNTSGHNWCCYVCAKKIWKRTNRCPVCNRTVMKVIKLFKV